MRLALDIGNTSVSYALFRGGKPVVFGSDLCGNVPKLFKKWYQSGKFGSIDSIVICSVVPLNTLNVINSIPTKIRIPRWIAGKNLPVPLKSKYKADQLGIDRSVNLYGALKILKKPFLVIDYGTAVTFDYVSKKGIFEGGLIIPGPEISFQSLIERAALLPKKMRLPKKSGSFLGRNTVDCLKSGVLQGYGAMTDELIRKFRNKYGLGLKVLATGGFSLHLKPHIQERHRTDPLHTLKSLDLLLRDFLNLRHGA